MKRVIGLDGLNSMLAQLSEDGFAVIGPTVADDAIVHGKVSSTADLPRGWTDDHEGGSYRLYERGDQAVFGYNLGPTSWKRFLFPPEVELLRIRRRNGDLAFEPAEHPAPKYAFVGVRACELAAIAIQDRVFLGHESPDPNYSTNRDGVFVVAVNCGQAGGTCFCLSMGTGPECTSGYDLVLTEFLDGEQLEYLAEAGSSRGAEVLSRIGGREATDDDETTLRGIVTATERQMGRAMDTTGLRDLLIENPNHARWSDVADRCLTCGNCTLACPTCFCSTVIDAVTLEGDAVRARKWDSCFSLDFSGLHRHPVRGSAKSRYRQWMTHKLATWHDQFGTSGCVGCGRCITWCPVGIDITDEVAAMREEIPV